MRLITLFLLVSSPLLLSEAQNPRRRIAIALSGGSALGLAHIGVLKYFEEHRIPIDYVAGTSMGALVGGFYASGVSTAEMERIASETDWNDLLSANPPFRDQPVVEKRYWNKPSGTLTLRFGRHFSLPNGISSGESLALLFSRYTAAYSNLDTFDELPIPFRCVATDLVTSNAVALDRGSLPKALRASMALPGVFSPVERGEKVLVDGGLVENLPVEAALGMGADVVIAVMFEGKHASQFTSLGSVLRQTISIPVTQNERRSASLATLVIRIQTGQLSGVNFENSARLIQSGYEAARANAAALDRFTLPPTEWELYLKCRKQRFRTLPKAAPLVAVASPQPAVQRAAEHEAFRELGTNPIQTQDLEYVIAGITTASGLPGAYYDWQNKPGKPQGYRVEFLPRFSTTLLVRPEFSFQLSSNEPRRGGLLLGLTVIPATTYKSRYLSEISLGYDPGIRVEYYHPLDGTNYFVAPGFSVQRYNDNLYILNTRSDFHRVRTAGSVRAGAGTGRFAQISMGLEAGYDSYGQPVASNGVVAQSGSFANLGAIWTYNTQDSGGLPTRGTLLEGSLGYSFRRISFPYLRDRFSTFHPVFRRVSLFAASDQESSFGRRLSFYDQFTYGGAGELEAYRYQEFHANTLLSARGGAFFHSVKARLWSLDPRLAAWYEVARLDLGQARWQTHQSTSVGAFFSSPVGVVGFALSVDEHGKGRVRLSIGKF